MLEVGFGISFWNLSGHFHFFCLCRGFLKRFGFVGPLDHARQDSTGLRIFELDLLSHAAILHGFDAGRNNKSR